MANSLQLRADPPARIVTCARGSSDHAASYGKYLIETLTACRVASAALSVASVYSRRPVRVGHERLCIAISQSGRSPDLLARSQAQKEAGAHVVALVNDAGSPLAGLADDLYRAQAPGPNARSPRPNPTSPRSPPRRADRRMDRRTTSWRAALDARCPSSSRKASRSTGRRRSRAAGRDQLFVIGRGYGFGIAQEAALKLKETCGLHAEAFSAAEVKPRADGDRRRRLPGARASPASDAAGDGVREAAAEFAARGARVVPRRCERRRGLAAACAHRASRDRADPDDPELLSDGERARRCARGLDPDPPLICAR